MSHAIRSILVTGANQGLGMHTVRQLGATPNVLIFMGSRKLAAAEEARSIFESEIHASSTVVPVQLDITDSASMKNAHLFIFNHLQGINLTGLDVLINNAGIFSFSFEEVYPVNVFGTAAITAAIRPLLNTNGAILNISSILGSSSWYKQQPPTDTLPAYASSKAALNSLTIMWALEEEKKGSGIRVVSICPGYNATNLNNYKGATDPADGCKVIVRAALEKEGRTGVYFNKDGDLVW
ncbi:short-chain dehydrogenase/reductase SDR [Mycena galericulata]|nr:short-chain dehydrogenase/reductase SDR [Mycena galericulata]